MRRFLIILFSVASFFVHAQKDTGFQFLKKIPLAASQLSVDNLNNIYILTANEQLKKYNANGDSAGVYNEVRRFGKLHHLDVSNPLKLLAFYKDFSTVVVLDRFLSVRSILDLRKQNILQASAIGLSYDNNIWVFDAINFTLKKLDEKGVQLFETGDFRTLFGINFKPTTIIDQNNSVYLYDPAIGVYRFDYFGTLQKKYPVTGWSHIAINNQHIIGIAENKLQLFNTSNYLQQQYQFPSSFGSFSSYIIANTTLFGLDKEAIHSYSFRF